MSAWDEPDADPLGDLRRAAARALEWGFVVDPPPPAPLSLLELGFVVDPPLPAPLSLDNLMRVVLEATNVPPPPERVKVARDVYEAMRSRAVAETTIAYRPTFSAVFGIPLEVDDELAPGEWHVVERGAS